MRLLDYLTGLVSLLALPFIAWWGVNQSPQSAAALEARLQSKAAQALQLAGIDWAIVSMDGQTAILTGAAPSEDAVDEAAALVLRSSGPGGVFMGGVSQVETRVTAAAAMRPYVWSAEKHAAGQLVLSGHVPSRAARAALLEEARALGKGPVVDEMVLAAGAPGGNWQAMARFAIGQALELDTGSAALTDTTLTVRGEVADGDLRARLTNSTRAVAAPFRGVALIRGAALWSATRTGNSLVLSGKVASEADRRALVTLARRSFSGEVIDEMTVEPMPEPDWAGGAIAGLAQFAAFGSGRMTYDAATGGFMFEGEAPASTLEFLNEDMTRAKGDWHFVIGVPSPAAPGVTAASAGVPAPCAGELDAALESAVAGFAPERAAFRRDSAPALDALALTAQRCDAAMEIEVAVGGDALDEARAAVVADFLERVGVQRPRVAAIGYGPAASVEGMDTERGRVSDPQIEFTVRERSGQ